MYKNMFKRAWLSVRRKPARSIIIALILFAISNLILAAIIIKTAVNETTTYAKASLGGTVTIQADMTSLRAEAKDNKEDANFRDKNFEPGQMFTRPSVTRGIADSVAASEYVKDYSYSITSSANNDNLTAVESTTTDFAPGSMGGRPDKFTTTESGTFSITGINAYAYIDAVDNGQMELTDGTYFNEGDADAIVISVDLAEANDLEVGDTITLTNIYTNKSHKLKIIGIYDNSSNFFDANTIYMNIDTAGQFLESSTCGDSCAVENVTYMLNDAGMATEFISWIENSFPELAENNLVASEDTTMYDQMVGPIESVGSFATVILWLVVIAGAVIITLIVITDVKDRRYEMGVLLSLGANKLSIIGQIFLELALVGTVSFVVSSCTATALANVMGQGILDAQVASAATEAANNFGRPTTGNMRGDGEMPGGRSDLGELRSMDGLEQVGERPDDLDNAPSEANVVISEIDINARPIDFLLLFACGYAIIIVALLLPSISILRYQPKEILQGKE